MSYRQQQESLERQQLEEETDEKRFDAICECIRCGVSEDTLRFMCCEFKMELAKVLSASLIRASMKAMKEKVCK